jgi:hypothetical protein
MIRKRRRWFKVRWKENKDEEKSHSESEAAESKDNDVVEFEKTWNVDFEEELKKKNSERQ